MLTAEEAVGPGVREALAAWRAAVAAAWQAYTCAGERSDVMFHCYWLEQKARNVWVGWAAGKPARGRFYQYPVTLTDLTTLPPTARVYVDGRRAR